MQAKVKICTKCTQIKGISDFSTNGDRINAHCKECRAKAYRQNYHQTEREQLRLQVKRLSKKMAAERYVQDLKNNHPCTDCKKQYKYYVMQFDHLDPNTKEANVATLVSQGASLEKIKKEIAKCELVCANCHAERTHQRRMKNYDEEVDSIKSRLDRLQKSMVS